jgi:hypothetical protein
MLNTLLSNCRKQNQIKKLHRIPRKLFSTGDSEVQQSQFLNETENLKLNEPNTLNETDFKIVTKIPNPIYESDTFYVHKSGMSFIDLFKKECDQKSILEVFEAVQYLLKASQGDVKKIRRFYVTMIVLAIHSSSLNRKIKSSLRKYFQLSDETKWRDNPLLKLCEDYNSVLSNPYAKGEVSVKVDKDRLRSMIILKSYLTQAIKGEIPSLEPWDIQEKQNQVSKMMTLMANSKGKLVFTNNG